MKNLELIKKYRITKTGENSLNAMGRISPEDHIAIKENKQEIIAILNKVESDKIERKEKIANINGLEEINILEEEWYQYNADFEKMINTGSSIMRVKKPSQTIKNLHSQYPRAAAYKRAYYYSIAMNFEKSSAGKKALEKIINNEDYAKAIEEMENEWTESAMEHIWD